MREKEGSRKEKQSEGGRVRERERKSAQTYLENETE